MRDGVLTVRTIPVRAVWVVALRDVAARDGSRCVAVRDVFARDGVVDTVPRDMVARTGAVSRLVMVRDGVRVASPRVVAVCDVTVWAPRVVVFAVRTAASATPMHAKNTARKDNTFLILSYNYNDIKKA